MHNNIRVRINDNWVPARDYQIEAFKNYKSLGDDEYKYDNDAGIAFSISRISDVPAAAAAHHGGTFITRNDDSTVPISDWDDVKVFLLDTPNVQWYEARNYQTWAYFDFIYSNDTERFYKTNGTRNHDDHIIIKVAAPRNIIFRMSRNDNGTIFYEKDDAHRTRIRISDNDAARRGYQGFYNRMTMDMGFDIIGPSAGVKIGKPVLPDGLLVEKTLDDNYMCIVCNDNKQNIQFMPCKHTNTCSECYLKLHKNECPICKQSIGLINKYE